MIPVKEMNDVMFAFPADVVREGYLPAWDDIPEEFRVLGSTKWGELFADVFYSGGQKGKDLYLLAKRGVDIKNAWRQINACMRSYEPKHEHKGAGVAFMFSEWFEDYEWKAKPEDAKDQDKSAVFFAVKPFEDTREEEG